MSSSARVINCVVNTKDVLGEVPLWDAKNGRLWWTDILTPAIHRMNFPDGNLRTWTPPDKIHSFGLRKDKGLIVAGRKGFSFYDPEVESFEVLYDPTVSDVNTLLNDGRVDRQGRFWVGSMDKMLAEPSGHLYCFDKVLNCRSVSHGVTLSNGIAISPNGMMLFLADSVTKIIYAFDLDPEAGTLANKRIFSDTSDTLGMPDGAVIDCEGCMWSARFDGGKLLRYSPDGDVIDEICLPVSRVTACTFGGPDLKTLFVTSAYFRLSKERLVAEPLAGALFSVEVEIPGVSESRFDG